MIKNLILEASMAYTADSIKIFEALKDNKMNGEHLFEKSGLKILAQSLLKPELRKNIRGGFIEISTIASTLHTNAGYQNSLDSFNINFVNTDNKSGHFKQLFDSNVSSYFPQIIQKLRDHNIILFNHPRFLINPGKVYNIYSKIDDAIPEKKTRMHKIAEEKCKRLSGEILNKGLNKLPSQVAPNLGPFEVRIRKSNIKDELTTYKGTTIDKPYMVKEEVERLFRNTSEENRLFGIHYINHRLFHEKFQTEFKRGEYPSVFISLPILDLHPTGQEKYMGIGCVFIFLLLDKKNFSETEFDEQISKWCTDILRNVKSFLTGYVTQIAVQQLEEVRKYATKSAISQVMARNMSHNIGSHVLSKYKDVEDIDSAGLSSTGRYNQYKGYNAGDALNPEMPSRVLMAYFNEYLKNRMDFLADIATSDPIMETPMYLVKDIIKGFDKNRILLNRISGISEPIRFSIKVIKDGVMRPLRNLNSATDPMLSIPNEILGAQAFYILLENIIRNIYKHSNPDVDFDIIIDFTDCAANMSFYEIRIYDSLSKEKDKIDKIVANRNKAFSESVLKNNMLRDNNLGTIEMEVCASYLRCLPITIIADKKDMFKGKSAEKAPQLIVAYTHEHTNSAYSTSHHTLGYKLYVNKPKEVLVIDDNDKFHITGMSRDDLGAKGVKIIKTTALRDATNYNHQIVYCLTDSQRMRDVLYEHKAKLSRRVVYADKNIRTDTVVNFIKDLWKKHIITLYGENRKYFITLSDIRVLVHIADGEMKMDIKQKEVPDAFKINISNHAKCHSNNLKVYDYCEIGCSHHKISKLIVGLSSDSRPLCEYLESVLAKIVIIDERIQENIVINKRAYTSDGERVQLKDYFQNLQVIIPNGDEANLNAVSFGTLNLNSCSDISVLSEADRIFLFIKKHITVSSFCVVHLGIIEKLLPSGTTKSIVAINDIINLLFPKPEERSKLIVTSGRGKPDNLPDDIPFIALAMIQNAVETLFDKYLLTKILYNARKKG